MNFEIIEKDLKIRTLQDIGMDPLSYVLERDLIPADGLWLEFGVFSGSSINRIAAVAPNDKLVYGFDSFEGLPEEWDRGRQGWWSQKGSFSREGKLPAVKPNVRLIKGWFDNTLVPFLAETPGDISFLHIDCDLYSSTKTVLDAVGPRLADRCVIVFDEIFNYPGWEKHEALAFLEFLEADSRDWEFSWIGINGSYNRDDPGNTASTQSAALVLRNKALSLPHDLYFGSFYTENYAAPNSFMVESYRNYNEDSAYLSQVDNRLLGENEYTTEGVRAFQKGNTIKWRLLIEEVERHLNSGVVIVFTDSDCEFTGPIDEVVKTFYRANVDIAFQGQMEGVAEVHWEAARARWKADINIGFIICHPTPKLLTFLYSILMECDDNRRNQSADNPSQEPKTTGWDQMVINEVLHKTPDAISWALLPLELVGKRGSIFAHHLAAQKKDFIKKVNESG